jgi:hypothetical protein
MGIISPTTRKALCAGAQKYCSPKEIDLLILIEMLGLPHFFNLGDYETESQVNDRRSIEELVGFRCDDQYS